MSNFKLEDCGGGKFSLSGHMSFDTAGHILRESEEMFEEHTRIEVDLFEVTETDSAGLALLLEWITWVPVVDAELAVLQERLPNGEITIIRVLDQFFRRK